MKKYFSDYLNIIIAYLADAFNYFNLLYYYKNYKCFIVSHYILKQ